MKILLATDGSDYSETAAKTLSALMPRPDAEITILYVIEPPGYVVTPALHAPYYAEWQKVQEEMLIEAKESATKAIQRSKQILSATGANTKALIKEGHPADVIVRVAEELEADLLVVGAKGVTGNPLFSLGSVSQKVIKYMNCSVLVTKSGKLQDGPSVARILFATDGSQYAAAAPPFLKLFQLEPNTSFTVMHVMPQEHHWALHSKSAQQAINQMEQKQLQDAEKLVEDTKDRLGGIAQITTSIKKGDPAEQILKTGSEMDANLIVLGSKGMSSIKRFHLGSVAQKVSRYSDKPVLLVNLPRTQISTQQVQT